jgi:glycosyltransferase involved in cell wall biosynthesis
MGGLFEQVLAPAEEEVVRDFYIATTWTINCDEIERRAAAGEAPRHFVPVILRRLGATLFEASRDASTISLSDRLRSRLLGSPKSWSLARTLAPRLGSDDVIFCLDAEAGIPLAAMLKGRSSRPKLVIYLHNLDRPRGRLASKLFRIADTVDLFCSCCSSQLEFVRNWLNISEDRTFLLLQHIDNHYFTPGPATAGKKRPVVAAVGRERRDYVTLAEATRDLNVDVWVDAWSAVARKSAKMFPTETPANMTYKFSKGTELVQLYRDADIVVVPMFPNRYAGITSLVEGLACERPIVASRTIGLTDYLTPPDGISAVEPSNPVAMREAIVRLLEHSEEARVQARQGYESVQKRYDFDRYIETVANRLESL